MTSRFSVAGALLLLSACEHGVDLDGTVVAPVEIQQLFSPEAPGQLIVVAQLTSDWEMRDDQTLFCMPDGQDRKITIQKFAFGCASDRRTQISAYAVPRTATEVDCNHPAGGPRPYNFRPEDALAVATMEVPVAGADGGPCDDGRVEFALTLEAIGRD